MSIKILIAEDDPIFRELICDIIKKLGYTPVCAKNGQEAIDLFFSHLDLALCILDVMMPIYDGWEVLNEIRQRSDVPILMLTALADEGNEIRGLTLGADDYIAKPFSYPLFVARIEAILRKHKKQQHEELIAGNIRLNIATHTVECCGECLILNHKEFALLAFFIKNKSIVFTRDQLLDQIWGYDFQGDERTVDSHIKMLRAKLGETGKYIITVRGTGYKFEVHNEKEYSI